MLILKYIFCALSFFSLMGRRKMSHKYIAFIPVVNSTFTLGHVSDSINKNYFKKTFNKFFLLISWLMSTILSAVSIMLLKNYNPDFYEKFFNSILKENSNFNITTSDFSSLSSSVRVIIFVCTFLFIVSLITNFVLSFSCYYTIYKEYSKNYSGTYLLLAIFGSCFLNLKFIPSLLVFLISKNTPIFEFLNKVKTNNN